MQRMFHPTFQQLVFYIICSGYLLHHTADLYDLTSIIGVIICYILHFFPSSHIWKVEEMTCKHKMLPVKHKDTL